MTSYKRTGTRKTDNAEAKQMHTPASQAISKDQEKKKKKPQITSV